jgi:hypothetical protein
VDDGNAPLWVRALDGLTDCVAYAFAAWTVFYEVALTTQWSLWWPARVWIALTLALVAWRAFSGLRERTRPTGPLPGPPPRPVDEEEAPRADGARWWRAALVVAAVGALVVLSAMRRTLGVLPVVLTGLAILVATCVQLGVRARRAPRRHDVQPESHAADLLAAAVCVGLAVLASALHGSSGDDVYYVNRATWVAQHGTPTLRDTVFSAGELPTVYGGGLPLASVEAWQGAVAHVLGVQAPAFVFVWTVPVLAAGAGWATWRLVRTWAPRRAGLVLLLATAFTLFSAGTVVGRYHIGAIWEGKVAAVAVVIPLAWHHLTMLAIRPRRAHLLVLLALGTSFVGLTSSAALMAPVMAAAALLAAVLLRSGACAAGAGCFALAPLLAGVASAVGPGVGGVAPTALPAGQVFVYLFGADTAMVALGVVGTVLGPRTMRGPAPPGWRRAWSWSPSWPRELHSGHPGRVRASTSAPGRSTSPPSTTFGPSRRSGPRPGSGCSRPPRWGCSR